jgi:hypothetical protein
MTRWQRGEATIEQMLKDGELQALTGIELDGRRWIAKARQTLVAAHSIAKVDPDSAYVLAYDAARFACVALLAHQGLRPTTTGGHYAVDLAIRAQFGGPFEQFGGLRRQRNVLEYKFVTDSVTSDDANEAVKLAGGLIDAAEQMLPHLGLFVHRA